MNIRPFNVQTDLDAAVALLNTYERVPVTADQFAGWLERNPSGRDIRRWVGTNQDGQVVAYAYANHENYDAPGYYEVWMVVDPAWRGRGLGAAMLNETITYTTQRGANKLTSETRDNDSVSMDWLQRRGFNLERHRFESFLDLTTFDETPFLSLEAQVLASGIRILSLAELGDTRENLRKLHAVNYATALDIPGVPSDWTSFEDFESMARNAKWFRAEGQFGALDGENWIGLSAVSLSPEQHGSYNLMTGVMREYRGRGIALALKLAGIRYARCNGAVYMRTHNDSLNAPILAINRKLGYVAQAGIYILSRTT
jgi:GNAT superfamily N-acetyltransferase